MLKELHIENIAVIEKADIEFTNGFIVLTGETGAGKSIIIDSIGAVLGERMSRDFVRRGADKGSVMACFEAPLADSWLLKNGLEPEEELIIQRRISADGKSACRVNGLPITATQLKELGSLLIDIHGQNDGRQLMDERCHMAYLDRFAELQNSLDAYKKEYKKYSAIKKEISSLQMDEIEKARLSDTLRYQIEELERAELKAGEYDAICARRDLLRNSEKLTEALDEAYRALALGDDNAIAFSQNASYYANKASMLIPELDTAANNISEAIFNLSNAAELISDYRANLDFSPDEYDALESRISLLNKLRRKYNRDEDELIEHLAQCREKLDMIEYADDRLIKLERELEAQKEVCLRVAFSLSEERKIAAKLLQKRIETELKELNMPSVRFAVEFVRISEAPGFDKDGLDIIRFVMSANAGEQLGRISKIASGGELSRIMLAMKNVFAENDPVGTLIFDEIDTGVSGIAAQRVGEKLFSVSKGKQVLCVTHLPQIAAMADSHYVIAKKEHDGRTFTSVSRLNDDGRRHELARLHGGENITQTTLASAKEQLEAAEKFKNK